MFEPVKSKKVYQLVVEQIQSMIADGRLRRGDKLPSERELTERLGISRSSLREALRSLEMVGLIESRHGGGNYIREALDESLFQAMSMVLKLHCDDPADILEVRRSMEVEAASLAARRVTPVQAAELNRILETLEEPGAEEHKGELDARFHRFIAQIAGNQLMLRLLQAIAPLLDAFIRDARRRLMTDDRTRQALRLNHRAIAEAIASRQPQQAADAMRRHFDLATRAMVPNTEPDAAD